jgi:hypothetical protein
MSSPRRCWSSAAAHPAHRILTPTLLLVPLFAASLIAQKTCFVANETRAAAGAFLYQPAVSPFCLEESTGASATVITAADFYLESSTLTSTTLELYDQDPVTRKPGNRLAATGVTLVRGVAGWYGGVFSPPVQIPPNTSFFIGVDLAAGIQPMVSANGPGVRSTPHWWNKAAGWTGPVALLGWKYRVYCDTHRGGFAGYGSGKMGTGGGVPVLVGQGWPNTGNQVSLNLSGALPGAPALLLWGGHANLPVPPGTLHVSPVLLATLGTPSGPAPGSGSLLTDVTIPRDAALAGARIAFQSWILDAGATLWLSHSNGVEGLIGHAPVTP